VSESWVVTSRFQKDALEETQGLLSNQRLAAEAAAATTTALICNRCK
jgi:hypothetical protein